MSKALVALVEVYRRTLAIFFGGQCRFEPTCSVYAQEALRTHGAIGGIKRILVRLSKCHPWGPYGFDPVDEKTEAINLPGLNRKDL